RNGDGDLFPKCFGASYKQQQGGNFQMKLNKVLALALSGVMAVSMLAGCSGNPGNGGQEGEGEGETNVTGFAATVASKLDENKDNVTVTSSDAIDAALKAAMVKPDDNFITSNRT